MKKDKEKAKKIKKLIHWSERNPRDELVFKLWKQYKNTNRFK